MGWSGGGGCFSPLFPTAVFGICCFFSFFPSCRVSSCFPFSSRIRVLVSSGEGGTRPFELCQVSRASKGGDLPEAEWLGMARIYPDWLGERSGNGSWGSRARPPEKVRGGVDIFLANPTHPSPPPLFARPTAWPTGRLPPFHAFHAFVFVNPLTTLAKGPGWRASSVVLIFSVPSSLALALICGNQAHSRGGLTGESRIARSGERGEGSVVRWAARLTIFLFVGAG